MDNVTDLFAHLKTQFDIVIDSVDRLKQENVKLKAENEALKQNVSKNEANNLRTETPAGIETSQADKIKARVKTALDELNHLRTLVTAEN